MQIIHEAGFAVDKEVEVVINSANGWLIQDSSGAGKIRLISNPLTELEQYEFNNLFSMLPKDGKELYLIKQKAKGWKNRKANLESVKIIIEKGELHSGDAVIDRNSIPDKILIHAITMSYDEKLKERISGTMLSVQTAIESALRLAISEDAKSISLPIPCAREGYGLNPKKSMEAVETALKIIDDRDIKVIICHDNEETKKLLN